MKKVLLGVFAVALFSCSKDSGGKSKQYITDGDFKIELEGWETWGDTTDDGVDQNVLIDSGSGEKLIFVKKTGEFGSEGAQPADHDYATTSANGLLIFNNYWGEKPKTMDFTVDNQFIYSYNSKDDPQATAFEVSKTTAHFKKI